VSFLSNQQSLLWRGLWRWYLDGFQYRGKHRPRLLLKKSLCRSGSIKTLAQEVVDSCEARTLS
jgi:hypothetical protein